MAAPAAGDDRSPIARPVLRGAYDTSGRQATRFLHPNPVGSMGRMMEPSSDPLRVLELRDDLPTGCCSSPITGPRPNGSGSMGCGRRSATAAGRSCSSRWMGADPAHPPGPVPVWAGGPVPAVLAVLPRGGSHRAADHAAGDQAAGGVDSGTLGLVFAPRGERDGRSGRGPKHVRCGCTVEREGGTTSP